VFYKIANSEQAKYFIICFSHPHVFSLHSLNHSPHYYVFKHLEGVGVAWNMLKNQSYIYRLSLDLHLQVSLYM
jgi:hypothetical protein